MNVMDYSCVIGIHNVNEETSFMDLWMNSDDKENYLLSSHNTPTGTRALLNGKDGSELYYIGLIDYLVPFNLAKKIEQNVRGLAYDKKKISVTSPDLYAKRLIKFLNDRLVNSQQVQH
eukprot:TRINITY_DN14694_c0_g1_i2.p1 TRINITY_DN14694_c0_g1~~TRINITY_DN14694_c0_g1_i2.p1  ORF type:complete len:118 (-),score=26.77 TRINITY_DN14694_c0_g1_i2:102-455(-)